ncbi:MAG: Abortive infection protein [Actinotalea sp.]|nr:Abortive infection protein [Actinotalea sp.]
MSRPADAPASADAAPSTIDALPATERHPAAVVPAVMVAGAGFLLFALELELLGYALLVGALAVSLVLSRVLARDMLLIAFGLVVMHAVPINTEVSNEHIAVMGTAMVVAVAVPYLVSRHLYRDHAIRFPLRAGRWTRFEKVWLAAVVLIGYFLLPVYMIRTGVYQNWPDVQDAEGIGRLFLGTNALGIWDELFFVCTCFALLRRHLPDWQANLVQAVLFTSFLYELGFHSWGPVLIYPFALVQGYTFKVTRSLTYIVCVHLLFDLILFLVLVHAHNRAWLDIFVY